MTRSEPSTITIGPVSRRQSRLNMYFWFSFYASSAAFVIVDMVSLVASYGEAPPYVSLLAGLAAGGACFAILWLPVVLYLGIRRLYHHVRS